MNDFRIVVYAIAPNLTIGHISIYDQRKSTKIKQL
jgi:hypothetical protein